MKEKLAKLIDVKSIVTIILTAIFAYLSVVGTVTAQMCIRDRTSPAWMAG